MSKNIAGQSDDVNIQRLQSNTLKLHEINSRLNFGNTDQQVTTVHKMHSQHKYELKSRSSTHRRSQDFVWGVHFFLPKKADYLF